MSADASPATISILLGKVDIISRKSDKFKKIGILKVYPINCLLILDFVTQNSKLRTYLSQSNRPRQPLPPGRKHMPVPGRRQVGDRRKELRHSRHPWE